MRKSSDNHEACRPWWILVDTETTGLNPPIFPVEIAARPMLGWEPEGEPFHALIDFDVRIEGEAQRIHGYTREYLREHGKDPAEVLSRFRDYAGDRPVCAYNLAYDWDKVLVPAFRRVGLQNSLRAGFCVLDLVRNVVPGLYGYRLLTVAKALRVANRQTHHALDDVNLTAMLLKERIGPHLEQHCVTSLEDIRRCAAGTLKVPPLRLPKKSSA